MSTKIINVNRSNLEECRSIVASSRKNIRSILDETIQKLNNNIVNSSYFHNVRNIDMTEAKEILDLTKKDLNKIIEDQRKTICLIQDIGLEYSRVEKNTNKQIEISEERYNKIIALANKRYNITNQKNSMLKGTLGASLTSMIASTTSETKPGINTETDWRYKAPDESSNTNNDTAGVSKTIAEALRSKNNSSSKGKKQSDPKTNTNATTSKTTTNSNKYNAAKTNSIVTTSGIGAVPAVTVASTKASEKLVETSGRTTKVKKQTLIDNIPSKRKQQSLIDDISKKLKKEVVPNDVKPYTPEDTPTIDTKPKTPTNNNDNSNTTIKPDTPSIEPNPKDKQPTNTVNPSNAETNPAPQDNASAVVTNTTTVRTPKHTFTSNTNQNNQVTPNNQPTTNTPETPSPSLSDNINNNNTTDLFDTNIDDFSDIEESLSSVGSNKSTGGSGVIPIAAGLGAAAAVGIGAKIYKDRKENNDLDLNEDRPSNENKFWTTDDSMVIHSEKDEYDSSENYPTAEETTTYQAVDNSLEEEQKDTWEIPEQTSNNEMIDLLGNE